MLFSSGNILNRPRIMSDQVSGDSVVRLTCKINYYNKFGFTFEKPISSIYHVNRIKGKNHMIILINAEKAIAISDKISQRELCQ